MPAELLDSPADLLSAARSYTSEALEVIAKIMRNSDSEKMRLCAAMALLDRATPPRIIQQSAPALEAKNDLRARLLSHINDAPAECFDEQHLRTVLALRSPPQAIRATLVQMARDGAIARTTAGSFTAK